MSGWYYLVAQLPSFSVKGSSPLPISVDYAEDLCSRSFGKRENAVLRLLSLEPPRTACATGSAFVDAWFNYERSLRMALAGLRAARLKKEFSQAAVGADILQTARIAFGMDPLAAELYLNDMRAAFLDEHTPQDSFSTDSVYAYLLKLKLADRIRRFSEEAGMTSYRRIYDHILGESK